MADVGRTNDQTRALWFSTVAFTVCFRGVDDLLDHRRPDKEGPRPHRYRVRPARRHADPHRQPDPPHSRHLDRPVRRPRRLCRGHAGGGGRDLAAHLRLRLHDLPDRGARRRHSRRIVRGRHRLCVALVPGRQAGHRARHLRRRQCRRGGDQVPRAARHGRLRLEGGGGHLGSRPRRHGDRLLARHQGRPRAPEAPQGRAEARADLGDARAAQEAPGLALLALLLLRLRRLRRLGAVAAALLCRRLRPRHRRGRLARRRLLDPRLAVPRPRRNALRQIRRAPGDVLELHRRADLHLRPVLSRRRPTSSAAFAARSSSPSRSASSRSRS